jgi:hypothetical protein
MLLIYFNTNLKEYIYNNCSGVPADDAQRLQNRYPRDLQKLWG